MGLQRVHEGASESFQKLLSVFEKYMSKKIEFDAILSD